MKINKKTILLVILFCLILVIGIQLIAVAIEVPLSLYYSDSNTDWWQYQFDNYPDYTNHNCGPACSAMLINYLKGKGVTTTYHVSISSAYPEVHCYARWDYCKANGYPNGYNNSDWSTPGATTEQVISALSSENIQTHTFTGYDCCNDGRGITNLQNAIDQGKVCICLVDPSYYRVTECLSHWVVAYGYDNNYIYLNDPGYITGQGFQASKSDFADALWYVKELSTVIVSDTTIYNYPIVSIFSVNPISVTLGNSFNISYTVSDDIGLQQTELWRVNDVGGEPGDWNTSDNPIFTKVLSGQKNYSGYFTDTPNTIGTYWYGMHVVDTSGNWSVEPDPPGPIMVTVTNPTPTIYVPDDYSTIQEAVDAASSGDTIIVRDGTYTENVNIDKDHLIIRSENGAEATIVQAANSDDHVFEVTADYVHINGFTVKGAIGTEKAGIYLHGSESDNIEYCNISNNIISDYNYNGIQILYSSNNTLANNIVSKNWGYGITLAFSDSNTLSNNIVMQNANGIRLATSSNNTLSNNIVESHYCIGISIAWSYNNTLTNNTISNNPYNFNIDTGACNPPTRFIHNIDTSNTVNGKPIQYLVGKEDIVIDSSWEVGYLGIVNCNNIVVKDLDLSNNYQGILLASSTNSRIENVNLHGNAEGICLAFSSNNTLVNNVVKSNTFSGFSFTQSSKNNAIISNTISNSRYGVRLFYSSDENLFYYNNFIENQHGLDLSDVHTPVNTKWNSPEEIAYIYNGNTYTNYLGNYWDDYTGEDTDNNGIGNIPYSIDGDQDNYPLISPFENYSLTDTTNLLGDLGSAGGGPPDGVVDFEDLMIFALAYGSTPADSNWNEVCDIASQGEVLQPDGVIDFEDLMIFAMNYGKTCTDL